MKSYDTDVLSVITDFAKFLKGDYEPDLPAEYSNIPKNDLMATEVIFQGVTFRIRYFSHHLAYCCVDPKTKEAIPLSIVPLY